MGTLSGSVKFEDGKAVSYATVVIKSINKLTLTDEDGVFELTGIPYGEHEIDVISMEIKQKTFQVAVKRSHESVTFTVEPSVFSIDEVVISANSKKKDIETKGFAVTVVEPQKIALQSIQTNELLDRTVGVRIRQDGGLGSQISYNINGLSGNAIKIFIDGVPASNFGSAFSLNNIPPSMIDRIEVYKGVVPGNLSEDALGGAINIVLKQKTVNSLVTSYSYGSFNTHQWNASGNFRSRKGLVFEASAFYNYSDNDYKVWGPEISFRYSTGKVEANQTARRFHDAYRSYGTKFGFGFTKVRWADRFLVGGVLSNDYKEVQHGITMNNVYGDRHARRDSKVITLTYDKKDLLLKGLSLRVDASNSYLKRQVIDTVGIMYDWTGNPLTYPDGTYVKYTSGAEVGDAKTAAINKDKTYMVRLNMGYAINDWHVFYVNYLFNDFVRAASDEYEPLGLQMLKNTRDLQKNIVSVTYENIAFSERLRTSLFYKHYFQEVISNEPYREDEIPGVPNYKTDKIRRNMDHSGYGLTLSFALLPDLHLLGSAEKAIRLPNANEIFGNNAENLLPTIGLLPETSYNANIGVSFGPFSIKRHAFRLNASVYYRDTQGMIRESVRAGSFTYSQFENLEDVLTKGIDAEFTYHYAEKISFSFNVSKFNALFNREFDERGDPYKYYRMQIRNEPSFKFNSNITYFHDNFLLKGSKASVYVNVNYVKIFRRNWANVGAKGLDWIPTQYPADAGFSYTFPSRKFVVGFDAKNIFNQQVFDNFGLQKPGRAFYAKITCFIF